MDRTMRPQRWFGGFSGTSRAELAQPTMRAVAADGLLHRAALSALALLIVNDQVLKAAWPGLVTGKLSDVAGLVLAPLVLQAGWEAILAFARRPWGPSRRALVVAVAAVGIGFSLAKTLEPAADAFRIGLGILQWPVSALAARLGSDPVPGVVPVAFVRDPWDLIALVALVVPIVIGVRRVDRARDG